jgi:hypothetical protein
VAPPAGTARGGGRFRSALASAVVGFIAGAACWHVVGFWTFMRDVLLKGPGEAAVESAGPKPPARIAAGPAIMEDCVAVSRGSVPGEIHARPCLETPVLLRINPSPRRGDLAIQILARSAPAEETWATTVSAD